ncbi:hypothetical protein [Enterovibrio norvegicus]|uniref:hypothetical protein n=1 Tax=Enterovibrio norvegicus TaxID=188144 RepID=UPI00352EF7D9
MIAGCITIAWQKRVYHECLEKWGRELGEIKHDQKAFQQGLTTTECQRAAAARLDLALELIGYCTALSALKREQLLLELLKTSRSVGDDSMTFELEMRIDDIQMELPSFIVQLRQAERLDEVSIPRSSVTARCLEVEMQYTNTEGAVVKLKKIITEDGILDR